MQVDPSAQIKLEISSRTPADGGHPLSPGEKEVDGVARSAIDQANALTDEIELKDGAGGSPVQVDAAQRAISIAGNQIHAPSGPPSGPPVGDAEQQGAGPLDPVPPLASALPAPPLTNAEKIQKIKDLVNAPDATKSTQEILKEVMVLGRDLGADYNIRIESVLDKNKEGKFKAETFSSKSRPDDTFYKVGIRYEIRITKKAGGKADGVVDSDLDIPAIERDIYTTSKTPEGAIVAAKDFTKTVIHLAKRASDPSYKEGFENYDKVDDALKMRSFRFNYHYENGRPLFLDSISGGQKGKPEIEMRLKQEKDYFYYRDLGTNELKRIKKSESGPVEGRAIYGSETEALLESPYVVSDASIFERIAGSSSPGQQISDIKERIKKTEQELADLKALFAHQGFVHSGEDASQFRQFLADRDYAKGKQISENELSQEMQDFIGLQERIQKNSALAQELGLYDKLNDELESLLHQQEAYPDDQFSLNLDDLTDVDLKQIIDSILRGHQGDPAFEGIDRTKIGKKAFERCLEIKREEIALHKDENGEGIALKAEYVEAKKKLDLKHKEFYNKLAAIERGNAQLLSELERLKQLRSSAEAEMYEPTATDEARQTASMIFDSVSEKELAKLEASTSKNRDFIKRLYEKLGIEKKEIEMVDIFEVPVLDDDVM